MGVEVVEVVKCWLSRRRLGRSVVANLSVSCSAASLPLPHSVGSTSSQEEVVLPDGEEGLGVGGSERLPRLVLMVKGQGWVTMWQLGEGGGVTLGEMVGVLCGGVMAPSWPATELAAELSGCARVGEVMVQASIRPTR